MSDFETIYAVDFDGTLCESQWPGIGAPNLLLIEHLIKKRSKGAKMILWSCREGDHLQEAVDWCKQFGLEFDAVNENIPSMKEFFGNDPRKVGATVYIDDKSVGLEKYNIPFHKNPLDLTLGSRWWFKVTETDVIRVHVEEITKSCHSGTHIRIDSDETDDYYKYLSIRREPEFFYTRLYPTQSEALKGEWYEEQKEEDEY